MKKILLTGMLLSAITAVQADVYCPQGPADCIKSTKGHVTCTLVGNDGSWVYKKSIYPLNLPQPNTHYYFPFSMAEFGIAKQGAECSYVVFSSSDMNGPSFESNLHLVRSTPGVNGWNPSPVGKGYFCQPTPGLCPFKLG